MSGIDERVVEMKFENSEFEKGVAQSIGSLEKLKQALKLEGATSGIDEVAKAASHFSLAGIAESIEHVASKFSVFGAIGFSVIQDLTQKALSLGGAMVKSVLDPIFEGGKQRALNIQQAEFQFRGLGLNVKASMASALAAVKGTAYGLDEAAKVASQFGAAGLKSGSQMTGALRGVAGVAALTGSSFSDIGQIFTTVAGQGKLMGDQLNQFAARGINIAAPLAKSMGVTQAQLRKMVSEGKVSFKDFAAAMDKAFGKHAQEANQTYAGSLANMHAALSRLGADIVTPKLDALRGVFNALTPVIDGVHDALMPLIKVYGNFVTLSGKKTVSFLQNLDLKPLKAAGPAIAQIATNMIDAITSIVKPIKEAFTDVFPPATGKQFISIVNTIQKFTATLKIGAKTSDNLKNTFEGLFSILDIGKQILTGVVKFFASFFSGAQKGAGGILAITGGIGKLLVAIDSWLKQGQFISKFFDVLIKAKNEAITPIMQAFQALGTIIGSLFSGLAGAGGKNPFGGFTDGLSGASTVLQKVGAVAKTAFGYITEGLQSIANLASAVADAVSGMFDFGDKASAAGKTIDSVNASFEVAADTGDKVKTAWDRVADGFAAIARVFGGVISVVGSIFKGIKDKISEFVSNMGIQDGLAVVNTVFFIAFYRAAKNFFDSFGKVAKSASGTLTAAKGVLSQVTSNLKTMQTSVRSDILLKIAASIGVLAASLYVLSKIKPAELAAGLGAIVTLLAALTTSFAALQGPLNSGAISPKNVALMNAMAIAMVTISGAVLLLSGAVMILGRMDLGSLAKGMGAVALILGAIVGAVAGLSAIGPESLAGAGAMVLLAGAMNLLVPALLGLAGVVEVYAKLDFKTLAVGVGKLALVLAALGVAMAANVLTNPISAAGIAILAPALIVLAGAIELWGHVDGATAAKGIALVGASLLIIGAGMLVLTTALPGAAAMVVITAALIAFVPVLVTLGSLPFSVIGKGLLTIVAVFVILGAAGVILAPIVPVLFGLGAAIALLGLGAALAGAGLFLFATGLTTLAAAGAVGAAAALAAIEVILQAIPLMAQQIGLGLVAFATVIANLAPQLTAALVKLLDALIKALIEVIPKVAALTIALIKGILKVLVAYVPSLVKAGTDIIIAILQGLTKSIPKIIGAATDLIIAFITAIGKNTAKLAKAGAKVIIDFVNSIADTIRTESGPLGAAGGNLAEAIIEGMVRGIAGGASSVVGAVESMAKGAIKSAMGVFKINSPSKVFIAIGASVIEGFVKGVTGNSSQIKNAYITLKNKTSAVMKSSAKDVTTLTAKLHTLEDARHKDTAAINKTKAALKAATLEHKQAAAAYSLLTGKYKASTIQLEGLANQYTAVAAKLKTANDNLAAAQKTRDDYAASIKDQFDNLPDVISDTASTTPLEDFANSLRTQIADIQTFTTTLQKLRDLGLNDALYKQLLAKGPSAQPFIDELLAGGADQVKGLDALSDQLDAAAGDLGTDAGNAMYGAGVAAAQGIVDGLKSQEAAITAQMTKLSNAMVAAIKKALGIKSPSKEMAEVGAYAGEGVVVGLNGMSKAVNASADNMGKGAILSLQKSIAEAGQSIFTDDVTSPVITPVLDLSQVQVGAASLTDILAATPVTVGTTYTAAKSASDGVAANAEAMAGVAPVGDVTNVSYVQNNNSPKALSPADVYRGTSNQLSVLKKGLPGAKSS